MWGRKRRKSLESAVAERQRSEQGAREAEVERQKLIKMGQENHFANAIIESVMEGYEK